MGGAARPPRPRRIPLPLLAGPRSPVAGPALLVRFPSPTAAGGWRRQRRRDDGAAARTHPLGAARRRRIRSRTGSERTCVDSSACLIRIQHCHTCNVPRRPGRRTSAPLATPRCAPPPPPPSQACRPQDRAAWLALSPDPLLLLRLPPAAAPPPLPPHRAAAEAAGAKGRLMADRRCAGRGVSRGTGDKRRDVDERGGGGVGR
jgi:hypothetical protein